MLKFVTIFLSQLKCAKLVAAKRERIGKDVIFSVNSGIIIRFLVFFRSFYMERESEKGKGRRFRATVGLRLVASIDPFSEP